METHWGAFRDCCGRLGIFGLSVVSGYKGLGVMDKIIIMTSSNYNSGMSLWATYMVYIMNKINEVNKQRRITFYIHPKSGKRKRVSFVARR